MWWEIVQMSLPHLLLNHEALWCNYQTENHICSTNFEVANYYQAGIEFFAFPNNLNLKPVRSVFGFPGDIPLQMIQNKDDAHSKAMREMQELMHFPEGMNAWYENKRKTFETLPKSEN